MQETDPPKKVTGEALENALTDRFPSSNLSVLAHFYRGELSRSIAWRQKMDMTTHWAVISTTAIISLAFSNPESSHMILPFGTLLLCLLLTVEARRYRFFDVWRTRVRMLEVHLLVPALYNDKRLIEGDWREVLCNDLLAPTYKMSMWEAFGRRLARTYIWLFLIILGAWLLKVYLEFPPPSGTLGLAAYYQRFSFGGVMAPWIPLGVMGGGHLAMLAVLLRTKRDREVTGETRRKDPNRRKWPI